jgi:hypothetical protein
MAIGETSALSLNRKSLEYTQVSNRWGNAEHCSSVWGRTWKRKIEYVQGTWQLLLTLQKQIQSLFIVSRAGCYHESCILSLSIKKQSFS